LEKVCRAGAWSVGALVKYQSFLGATDISRPTFSILMKNHLKPMPENAAVSLARLKEQR
jgi:hypothetical protein